MTRRFAYSEEERAAIVAALPPDRAALARQTADPNMMIAALEAEASVLIGQPKAPLREAYKRWREQSRRVVRAADEMLDALGTANQNVPPSLQRDAPLMRSLAGLRRCHSERTEQLTEDLRRSRKDDQTRAFMLALAVVWWEEYGGQVRFGDGKGPLGRFLRAVLAPIVGEQRAGSPEALAAAARKASAHISIGPVLAEEDLNN